MIFVAWIEATRDDHVWSADIVVCIDDDLLGDAICCSQRMLGEVKLVGPFNCGMLVRRNVDDSAGVSELSELVVCVLNCLECCICVSNPSLVTHCTIHCEVTSQIAIVSSRIVFTPRDRDRPIVTDCVLVSPRCVILPRNTVVVKARVTCCPCNT